MRVLFVGEGLHDVGNNHGYPEPVLARGTVPTLVRVICPFAAAADSLAIKWAHIAQLPPPGGKMGRNLARNGYRAKAKLAVILSAMKYHCAATVCVVDGDTAPDGCLDELREGLAEGVRALGRHHSTAYGIALQSIEAWTLGDREAIAEVLQRPLADVAKHYPSKHVEELSERSRVLEQQPKRVLAAIVAGSKFGDDCLEFREEVAQQTDIARLERACPAGFKPFAELLRAAFSHQ